MLVFWFQIAAEMWTSQDTEVARQVSASDMLWLSPPKSMKRLFLKPLDFGFNFKSSLLIYPCKCLMWFIVYRQAWNMTIVQVSRIRRKVVTAESCSLTVSSGNTKTAELMVPHPVCVAFFWLCLNLYQSSWSIFNVTRGRPVNWNKTPGKFAPTCSHFQVHQIWHLFLSLPKCRYETWEKHVTINYRDHIRIFKLKEVG